MSDSSSNRYRMPWWIPKLVVHNAKNERIAEVTLECEIDTSAKIVIATTLLSIIGYCVYKFHQFRSKNDSS